MSYLTREQVGDWATSQTDEDALYCEDCLTKLAKTDDGKFYCPNEMCLNFEEYEVKEEE